jgi:hypothetical protein
VDVLYATYAHEFDGQEMSWKAPLPKDMQALIKVLQKYDPA